MESGPKLPSCLAASMLEPMDAGHMYKHCGVIHPLSLQGVLLKGAVCYKEGTYIFRVPEDIGAPIQKEPDPPLSLISSRFLKVVYRGDKPLAGRSHIPPKGGCDHLHLLQQRVLVQELELKVRTYHSD